MTQHKQADVHRYREYSRENLSPLEYPRGSTGGFCADQVKREKRDGDCEFWTCMREKEHGGMHEASTGAKYKMADWFTEEPDYYAEKFGW